MNRDDYLNTLNRPGAFQAVEWKSEVKPAAAHKGKSLVKITRATVRTGVDYANLAVNAERETGELPWGEWEIFPVLIAHKGNLYARLYCLDGSLRTTYTVDGQEVDRDDFLALLTPSARQSNRPTGGTVSVKLDNLTLL